MEEEKNDLEEQIKFSQLLKELTETQVTLAKIEAQLAIREGKNQVKEAIASAKENLEIQAKRFGANLKKIEEDYRNGNEDRKEILEEYESSLEEINDTYYDLMQDILEKKAQLEVDEQETMMGQKQNKIDTRKEQKNLQKQKRTLKAEIIRATKEGRLDDAQQKMTELQELTANNSVNSMKAFNEELQTRRDELRMMIEDYEQQYETLMAARASEINYLTEDQNNKLAKIPKQNLFQKAMGKILDKFDGTKKFMQTAIEPLKAKITEIEENYMPKLKQEMSNKRQEFSDKIQNTIDNGKRTFKNVIEKGLQMKNNFIKSVQDKLNEQQQQVEQKMQILNQELNKKETEMEIDE